MRCAALPLLLLWPDVATGWVSISQSRFGVSIADVAGQMRGVVSTPYNPQTALGYLWSLPRDPQSDHGLGGGITYAWDPELCAAIHPRFKEDLFFTNFVVCSDLRAALHRAFSAWSDHHKHISFVDVTEACADLGFSASTAAMEACPLHEVFVTSLNTSLAEAGGTSSTSEAAATAVPKISYAPDAAKGFAPFTYTNGVDAYQNDANGVTTSTRDVIETYGGTIRISSTLSCWYLDSFFCAGFHNLKKLSSPKTVQTVGLSLLFVVWSLAMAGVVGKIGRSFYRQLKLSPRTNRKQRWYALLEVFAKQSVLGTAVRFVLVMIPWPFYNQIFVTCWNCYDFEAALTHEIGHLLGLGHPDLIGSTRELVAGYGTTPQNSYTDMFLQDDVAARYPNATSSLTLWDTVAAGTPPGAVLNLATGIRDSIMESFTTHNPHVCLTIDDIEALNTLYPVASGAVLRPNCFKSPLYIGFIRMVVYVVGPACFAVLLSVMLHTFTQSMSNEKMRLQAEALRAERTKVSWLKAGKLSAGMGAASASARAGGFASAAKPASAEPAGVEVTVM